MDDTKTSAGENELPEEASAAEKTAQEKETTAPVETAVQPEGADAPAGAEKEKKKNKKSDEDKNFFTRVLIPSKKNLGYGFAAYALLFLYFLWGVFCLLKYGDEREDYAWLTWCAIPAGVLALLALIQFIRVMRRRTKGEKAIGEPVSRFWLAFILSMNSMLMPDLIMGSPPVKTNIIYTFLGLALCMTLYLIGAAIFKSAKVYYACINGFFAFYAFMQYYIFKFRGAPIQFSDLFNIESAKEASDLYEFSVDIMPIYAIVNIIAVILILVKVKVKPIKARERAISGVSAVICAMALVFVGKIGYDIGIKNRYIIMNFSGNENKLTFSNVGYDLMFYFDGMYNHVYEPEGYSDKKAVEILSEYKEEKADKDKKPIIIGIMNESFADFRHIGDLKTDKDYMPCFNALKKESVYGYVTVSAYGGYSCNSEYEFLSGNTMGFLPAGSAAFTQYINGPQESLVSYLNSQNYFTMAVTPCSSALWNLEGAYKNLQFDDAVYNSHKKYFGTSTTVNNRVSDHTTFNCIREAVHRNIDKDESLFIWTTTMQNHGDYYESNRETTPHNVEIQGIDNSEASIYLDSIYLSDKAFGELVDSFRNYDREVIIVMFGDHYPHIMSFTEKLYGQDVSTLSTGDYARLHQTPFIIWSNKGTQSREIKLISLNYLSNEVMKVAGLPLSSYQQELEKVRQTLPVISSFGYMNSDNKWFEANDNDEKTEKIRNEYNIVEYYRMFGGDKKKE